SSTFASNSLANLMLGLAPVLVILSLMRIAYVQTDNETLVAADPERVFAVLTDPARRPPNRIGRVRYRGTPLVEHLPTGGTKGRARMTSPLGVPGKLTWETLEYEPPKHVATFARA